MENLTIEKLQHLKGKRIETICYGYRGQNYKDNFIVGGIKSEYELAADEKMEDFPNRLEYWKTWMTKDELEAKKNIVRLITADGRETFIRAYLSEGVFWGSDYGRFVYFKIIEDEN